MSVDLLTLFVVGLGALALGLWAALVRASANDQDRPWRRAGSVLILTAMLLTLGVLGRPPEAWWLPAALTGAYGGIWALPRPLVRRLGAWVAAWATGLRLEGAAFATLGLLLVGWCFCETKVVLVPIDEADYAPASKLLAALHEDPRVSAATDQGRKVRLLTAPADALPEAAAVLQERRMMQYWTTVGGVIRQGPPDGRANCHGWTFTQGRWWIPGEEVPRILKDNGYAIVPRPEAGDIVVYGDEAGTIAHTGIVFAVGERGAVMIESKWCWLGRYLHLPEAQPYGKQIAYYHSARSGHGLWIHDHGLSPGTDEPGRAANLLHASLLDQPLNEQGHAVAQE